MTGFIKVYREALDGLLQNPTLLQVWMYLNSRVWFRETIIDGIEILPGQVLITANEIALACNLNEHNVRYALDSLDKKGFLQRNNIRNRYSLITMLEPGEKREPQAGKPSALPKKTAVEPTKACAVPEEHEQKDCCGLFLNVLLTKEENRRLHERTAKADSYIEKLSAYKRRTDKKYDDDFAVLLEWICEDEIKKTEKPQPAPQQPVSYRPAPQPVQQSRPDPDLSWYQQMNTDFFTAPASYDLEKAEALARSTVPKLRKRNGAKI